MSRTRESLSRMSKSRASHTQVSHAKVYYTRDPRERLTQELSVTRESHVSKSRMSESRWMEELLELARITSSPTLQFPVKDKTKQRYLLIVHFASYRFRKDKEMISSITGKYFQSCFL